MAPCKRAGGRRAGGRRAGCGWAGGEASGGRAVAEGGSTTRCHTSATSWFPPAPHPQNGELLFPASGWSQALPPHDLPLDLLVPAASAVAPLPLAPAPAGKQTGGQEGRCAGGQAGRARAAWLALLVSASKRLSPKELTAAGTPPAATSWRPMALAAAAGCCWYCCRWPRSGWPRLVRKSCRQIAGQARAYLSEGHGLWANGLRLTLVGGAGAGGGWRPAARWPPTCVQPTNSPRTTINRGQGLQAVP